MIIYLDQNKWIELAKMLHGKDVTARGKRVLLDFEAAIADEHVSIPLSAFHYIETSRISNVQRKIRLGEAMWRFSKGRTIASYSVIVRHELELALAKQLPQVTPCSLKILGRGHAHAFGTDPLRGILANFEDTVERSMLVGNDEFGVKPLTSNNTKYRENFLEHLASIHARLNAVPNALRDDWLYAMSAIDILDPINDVIIKHGLPKTIFTELGATAFKEFINSIPTRRVDLHLHRQVLRNPNYFPRLTDLEDWGSLALASCYCDVVVCEKHMADMLKRDGFKTHARIETDIAKAFAVPT